MTEAQETSLNGNLELVANSLAKLSDVRFRFQTDWLDIPSGAFEEGPPKPSPTVDPEGLSEYLVWKRAMEKWRSWQENSRPVWEMLTILWATPVPEVSGIQEFNEFIEIAEGEIPGSYSRGMRRSGKDHVVLGDLTLASEEVKAIVDPREFNRALKFDNDFRRNWPDFIQAMYRDIVLVVFFPNSSTLNQNLRLPDDRYEEIAVPILSINPYNLAQGDFFEFVDKESKPNPIHRPSRHHTEYLKELNPGSEISI